MYRRRLSMLIVALGLIVSSAMGRNDDMSDDLAATDRLLRRADKAFSQGKSDVAVQLYGATIKAYEDIVSRQKDGVNDLLAVRLAYCKNQILALLAPRPAPRQLEQEPPATVAAMPQPAPLSPLIVAPEIEQAGALCRMGKFKQARVLITAYLESHGEDAYGHLMLSTAALGQGDMKAAARSLAECIRIAPALPEAHYNMTQLILRAGGDIELATQHYRRSVELGGERDSDLEDVIGTD